jgi:hypothetical protein
MSLKKTRTLKIILMFLFLLICVYYIDRSGISKNEHKHKLFTNESSLLNHLKIYDLNKPNDGNFECVNSTKIVVQTTICVHDIQRDIYVSGAIKNIGVWEYNLMRIFMRMVNSKPNINVLGKIHHFDYFIDLDNIFTEII